MKTKKEIQQEIFELLGAMTALGEAMDHLHEKRMDATKKLFALNHMLKDMKEGEE
jgi:hypothetical protein